MVCILLFKALENPDVRLSASHSFPIILSGDKPHSLSETQFLISKLTSILRKRIGAYAEHPIMQSIFKLKGQDIRRSAIYSLGTIGTNLLGRNHINYYYNVYNFSSNRETSIYPQVQREVIDTLTKLVADQEEDLDIRWIAAAELQTFNVSMDSFFLRKKLINPATALAQSRWIGAMELKGISNYNLSYLFSFPFIAKPVNPETVRLQSRYLLKQYGFIPGLRGIPGLDFDIYSKQYIHDNRLGCGAGLTEVYNTLQKLFNGQKK